MKPKTETREYGDCMLRIKESFPGDTRYTIVGSKKTILDFFVLANGKRLEVDKARW